MFIIHRIRQGEPGLPAIFDYKAMAENWVDLCFACNAFGDSQWCVCDIASLKRAMWMQYVDSEKTGLF